MLACRNINLTYSGRKVLRDVSVEVKPGCVTAIVGPSGAGKSTTLRSLAFLEHPASGSIILDEDIYEYPLTDLSRSPTPWPKLTAVFQQLFLWPHLTLRANISLPLTLRKVSDAKARVDDLISRFEMCDFIDRYPNEVSGGQRQRAALVRALALKPSYLLLDEITSALDVEQAASIVSHLGSLKRDGIGILIVTHHMGFLHRTADTIVFMEDGSVSETGSREILVAPITPGMQRFLAAVHKLEDKS